MGDSTIYQVTEVGRQIISGDWLSTNASSLIIFRAEIRPNLIGECAFRLSINKMKTTFKKEQKLLQDLVLLEKYAPRARKPINVDLRC